MSDTSISARNKNDVNNLTASVNDLNINDDLQQLHRFKGKRFDFKLNSELDSEEANHAKQVSERITFGTKYHLSTEKHPLYTLPGCTLPTRAEFLYQPEELFPESVGSADHPLASSSLSSSSPSLAEFSSEPATTVDYPSVLHAPAAAPPPIDGYYPLAPRSGFTLLKDARYQRGYVYVAPYEVSQSHVDNHAALLAKTITPPHVNPELINGAFVSSPIPGMVQMIPGIPFAFAFDGNRDRLHTIACVQTLESLRHYPDFGTVLELAVKLAKLTWGCADLDINPIYELQGLKENARSVKRDAFNQHTHDGSYNLANTVMKGEGQGTFLPAVQTNIGIAQISTTLETLHALYQYVMPKCISKFEYDITSFHADFNNILCFGGLGINGTSVQLNSSSLGKNLDFYIGNVQGGWHTDVHDDMCKWTLFTLLLRVGPSGDPGPFCLARSGLYMREKNAWIVFLVFKGTDLHSGFAPKEDPDAHQQWIDESLEPAWNLAGPQNRIGYVNYISTVPSQRTGSMNISPPTSFGNYGSSQVHKIWQKNFAMHGHATLGDRKSYANRLGREVVFNFWNSLQMLNLDFDMDINDLLAKISYQDHQSESATAVPLDGIPNSINPQHQPSVIQHYLELYEWHRREASLFHIRVSLSSKPNDCKSISTPSAKARIITSFASADRTFAPSPNLSEVSSETPKILKVLGVGMDSQSQKMCYKVLIDGEEEPTFIEIDSPRLAGNNVIIDWMEKNTPLNINSQSTSRITQTKKATNTMRPLLHNSPSVPTLTDAPPISAQPTGINSSQGSPQPIPATVAHSSTSQHSVSDNPTEGASHNGRVIQPLPKTRYGKSVIKPLRVKPSNKRKPSEDVDVNEEEYEVEKVLNHRIQNGIWQWEIQWKGYDKTDWMEDSQLSGCIELLQEYMAANDINVDDIINSPTLLEQPLIFPSQADNPPKKKRARTRVRLENITLNTVSNLNTLTQLLSDTDLKNELQQIKAEYRSPKPKEFYQSTSFQKMMDDWANQSCRNSFLRHTLTLLPLASPKLAGLELQLLQSSVEMLGSMGIWADQARIIERSCQIEICCSFVQIYTWLIHSGPKTITILVTSYFAHGYDFLKKQLPQFANLIDHIVHYVHDCITRKFGTVHGNATLPSGNRHPFRSIERLRSFDWGVVLDDLTVKSIPSDLYGLRISTTQTKIELPHPADQLVQHTFESLHSLAVWCLSEVFAAEIILPKIKMLDKSFSSPNTKQFDNARILQRSVTRGAILSCIATACGTTGIFASSRISGLLRAPAMLFNSDATKFAQQLREKKDVVLEPLFSWINDHLLEHPTIAANAKELGELAQLQMLDLFVGKKSESGSKSSASSHKGETGRTLKALKPIAFDLLIPHNHNQNIHVGVLGLILREALNRVRNLKIGDQMLHRVLCGEHATQGSTNNKNPDHTNPIRQSMVAVSLLRTHLPAIKITSKVGLSNLLSWMGTGQGYKTTTFLNWLEHPKTFFSSTLQELINMFQIGVNHNADIISRHPEHAKPYELPGIIAVDDMRIWGQPNNLLSAAPTIKTGVDQITKMTLSEKFGPYWSDDVQQKWSDFLGGMLDQDPLLFSGSRKAWRDVLLLLIDLKITGFGRGLTLFQLANHLAAFGIVEPPTLTDIADWISQHPKLGAYHGLENLGFIVSSENPPMSICCAFACIHKHLQHFLTQSDKDATSFSPILTEHILCKIPRWTTRLKDENATDHLQKLAQHAEQHDAWNPAENSENNEAFPFPLVIHKAWIQTVVEEENARAKNSPTDVFRLL